LAQKLPAHAAHRFAFPGDLKASVGVCGARLPAARISEGFDRRPDSLCEYTLQCFVRAVDDDAAGSGHSPHEVMELTFDRTKIIEDVSMIELEIVQNRGPRAVMHEL